MSECTILTMSESYLFAANKSLDQETIVWANQISPSNTLNFSAASIADSLNDTYVTAIDCSDSEYLSVLENTGDQTLEDLNLTLSNTKVIENVELNVEQNSDISNMNIGEIGDQVVVFTVEGSDELYGLQVLLDDHGNSQKYQFKLRQNENGQLEAIPETIHLLLNENEVTLEHQEEQLVGETQEFESNGVETENIIQSEETHEGAQSYQHFIKGEPSEQVIQEEENLEQEYEDSDDDVDVKPVVLQMQQAVSNMKSELYQGENSETQGIYHQEEDQSHIMYEEESNVEIFNENAPEEMYNQDEINHEIFNTSTSQNEIYHEEDSGHTETLSNQTEETLIQEDRNFYEENSEEVQTFETIQFNNDQMLLETQFLPEVEDHEDTDTDEEYPPYERIYVQTDDENLHLNEETVFNTEEAQSEISEEYNHQEINKNGDFQIIESVEITAQKQDLDSSYKDSPLDHVVPLTVLKQPVQNNVLKQQSASRVPKKSKKVLCYVVQHPEKENVNSIPPVMTKTYKVNPRSVLKQSAIDGSLIGPPSLALKQKDQHLLNEKAKLEKRFAKNKDAIQAKLFNNFLSKTTIPHAPIRQKRLPRKQEIKPVGTRTEEEIIVQEVMVSSNGFIESVEERLKGKEKLEVVGYIDLSDSEDENSKGTQKKSAKSDSVIEILSSEEESERHESANKTAETPKKRRGRPRKNPEAVQPSQKEDNAGKIAEEVRDSADESSPSKKTRTDESTEVESDTSKREFSCPLCSKTFPSPNSLSTHIQHHKLENSIHKSRPSTFEFKHKCLDCTSTFKNSILLNRHDCPKKNKKVNNLHQCSICKKTFDSLISLNLHKKSHGDDGASGSFPRPSAVAKRLTLNPKKASKGMNDEMESKKNETAKKAPVRPSLLPKKLAGEQSDGTDKYKCEICMQTFKNEILLKRHVCKVDKNNQHICKVCKLTFKDMTVLNIHKRKHIKENLVKTTSEVQISPMKFLQNGKRDVKKSPRKSLSHLKDVKKTLPSFKVLKKFPCTSCSSTFTSKVLLDIHTRKNCVKTPVNKRLSRRTSFGKTLPKHNLTIMPSTPIDMHAQCDACPKKFKSYKVLLKHQITEHGYSPPNKQELLNPKKKATREHTGIPANPRLQKSFAALMTKLQHVTPRKTNYQLDK